MQNTSFGHLLDDLPQFRLLHPVSCQREHHARIRSIQSILLGKFFFEGSSPDGTQFTFSDDGHNASSFHGHGRHGRFKGNVMALFLFFSDEGCAAGDVLLDERVGELGDAF